MPSATASSLSDSLAKMDIQARILNSQQADTGPSATKTLIAKPKGGKPTNPAAAYVAVIALQETDVPLNLVAKSLGFKEMRMVAEDVLSTVFGLSKEAGRIASCCPTPL